MSWLLPSTVCSGARLASHASPRAMTSIVSARARRRLSTSIGVSTIGIVVNSVTAWLFMAGRKGDLNIKGAYLHMAGDAGVSLGVVVSGLAIGATGWLWLDPTTSLVIVAVILVGTWGL
ncbi:MAG: cation transporter, partial [Gemmatimonadales bacterium]|nr:cation transporter [Gemmatimonadales bacterium]